LAETIERRRAERMAQEEMGVAAAAADEMGDIPPGGITGMPMMAMGGEVQRFQAGGTPRTPYRNREEQMLAELMGDPDAESAAGRALRDAGRAVKRGFLYSSDAEALRAAGRLPEASDVAAPASAAPAGIEQVVAGAPDMRAGRGYNMNRVAANQLEAERLARIEAEKKDKAAADAQQGIAAAPGIGFFRDQLKAAGFDPAAARKGQEEGIAALQTARRAAAEGAETDLEKEIAERGVLGEAREKRAREAIEGLEGKKGEAKSMALIEAGLAIMSADPSQGPFAAIAQGALRGVGAYKGDLKDLEELRERMLDKLDTLDDLRRQERMADGKERRAIRQRIRDVEVEGAKDTLQLSKDFDVDIPRAMASDVFKAWSTEFTATKNREALAERTAGTADDKKITAAEAAFQRDPEAAALRKQLENPMGMLDPTAQQRAIARLRQIQADKYSQFGVTMVEPSAGADMSGFRMIGVKQ
jgi:hypothetical protein